MPVTVGHRYKRLGRWTLWTLTALALGIVIINGVGRIFASSATAAPKASAGADAGLDAARAYAASFARTYLTWSPATAESQRRVLAGMFAGDVNAADAVAPQQSQRVVAAWAGPARVRGQAARIVVTCIVALDGTTVTQYLAVPIAWTLRDRAVDGLVVYDYPSFVSPPTRMAAPDDGGVRLDDADGDAIASLLTRFFAAYLAGGNVAPEFLTAHATIQPLDRNYALVGDLAADDVEQIGPGTPLARQIAATVRVRDDLTHTAFTLRYRVQVRRASVTGRWLVESI